MKTYLAAAVMALAVAAPAHAATFDGPFIGVDVGYDHAEIQETETDEGTDWLEVEHDDGRSTNGLAGGIFAGYDAKFGGAFFGGVEARAGLSAAKYSNSDSYTDTEFPEENESYWFSVAQRESFSATARVGYLLNESTGIYLRGGIVETRFKMKASYGILVGFDGEEPIVKNSVKDSNTGFLYGAGLETVVAGGTSLRVEYNVTQYGGVFNKVNRLFLEDSEKYKTDITNHQVRLAVSHAF